jgi:TolB-like protein
MSKGEPLMMLIAWLFNALRHVRDCFRLIQLELVSEFCGSTCLVRATPTNRMLYVAMIGASLIGFNASAPAWSADANEAKFRKTVAAGLGYQDADTSSITVKTYDAESGLVLSAETYELDIKDDGPSLSHPRTRIFAGGVGVGEDGLSVFMIRVYDAASGYFLWEGHLNLGVSKNSDVTAYPVVAQVQPRAVVMRVSGKTETTTGQPYFVLRAVDPETGRLIWADKFSADASNVKVERISRSVIGMMEEVPRKIDFRIKMPDEAGRQLLWEDTIEPIVDETEVAAGHDAIAENLPAWYSADTEEMKREEI